MMRIAPAATLAVAVAFLAGPVSAQTVPDYETALAAVPGSPPPAVAAACRPLQNYVATAMEPGGRKAPWLYSWLSFTPFASDPVATARHDCVASRETAVITFNAGSAEEIVTPPKLDDTDVLVRPVDPALQPMPGYDLPNRRMPRVR